MIPSLTLNSHDLPLFAVPSPELLSSTEAARLKGVSRQAIHKAAARGALNAERVGKTLAVHDDARFAAYRPQAYRGRKARGSR